MSVIGLVVFVAFFLAVLGLMHYYIWRRAVRSTTTAGSRWRRIGTWLVVIAFVSTGLAQVSGYLFPPAVAGPFAWVGFSWLGFAFYFFLFLLLGELVRLAVRIFGQRDRSPDTVAEPAGAPVGAPASAQIPASAPAGTSAGSPAPALAPFPSPATAGPEPDDLHDVHDVHDDKPDRTNATSAVDAAAVTRRLFLSRSIAVGAGVAAAGVGGYGITRALADPVIRRVGVQIAGLDPALTGFRIALFSDAHLGSLRRRAVMEMLVDTVNGTEPDLVAVIGDLIDGSVAELGDDVAPMAGLQSAHGTFFVTGNHEYYSGVQEWVEYLPDLGVRVLRNQRLAIERDGAAFDLAGVNDITGEDFEDSPDYEQALGGRRTGRPVVLLCHQPVNVDRAVEYGVDLQLSGHTHGGQMWPFHYVIAAQQGAVRGLSRIEDTQLYVTAGAGFWGPPMRVGADPEVVVIELASRGGPDD